MKNRKCYLLAMTVVGLSCLNQAFATNPIIMDQFTADPTARVFEGRMYLYPSHDIPASPGRGFPLVQYILQGQPVAARPAFNAANHCLPGGVTRYGSLPGASWHDAHVPTMPGEVHYVRW